MVSETLSELKAFLYHFECNKIKLKQNKCFSVYNIYTKLELIEFDFFINLKNIIITTTVYNCHMYYLIDFFLNETYTYFEHDNNVY